MIVSSIFRVLLFYNNEFYIGVTITLGFDTLLYFAFYLSMIFISFDRLLCSILHIKYDYYITSKRVKKVIFVIWVISIIMIIPYIFNIICFNGICYYHLPLLLGGVFIIVSFCAYGSIANVNIRRRKKFANQANSSTFD